MDWDIGRSGKEWTGSEGLEKLERLPDRLELMRGKLCFHESERRALLAGLLENIGLDEVVQLGRLQDWQQAITARAELEREPARRTRRAARIRSEPVAAAVPGAPAPSSVSSVPSCP